MSTLKVDAIRHNSATSDAITTAADGTCTAKLTSVGGGQLSHRNLIINGAMTIAQRATSSTDNGYAALDRYRNVYNGTDEAPTQSQVDVAAGTTPYTLGFRKALKITNGNQTGGVGSNDNIQIWQRIESQNMANSGWNYLSDSSFVTLQFWIKSSIAQNFQGYLLNEDSSQNTFPFETGSLTANTWTKVTKVVPGNSNLVFNNDNGAGLRVAIVAFMGTDSTSNSLSLDTWTAYNHPSNFVRDCTTTWYTTNDATLEITGLQLEVGDTATSFEHKSEQEELLRCYRYYYKMGKLDYKGTHMAANEVYGIGMSDNDNTNIYCQINFPVPMREPPSTLDQAGASNYNVRRDTTQTCTGNPSLTSGSEFSFRVNFPKSSHGWGTGQMLWCMSAGSSSYLGFSAEL